MKTEKTAVLAVISQKKKSITSINLFTLSTLIERISQLVACLFYVCQEFKKKYYLKENIALTLIHGGATILIVICKSKIIVRVLKGQKLTKIVLFRIARAPFAWVRYTAFF